MYAAVHSGDIARAEQIFNRTLRTNLADMRELVDARVLNTFIEAHLRTSEPNSNRAMDWYRRFGEELQLKPNNDTFAVLIRHFLHTGDVEQVEQLVKDMEQQGVTIAMLFENERFVEKEDRTPLEAVLRQMGKDLDGSVTADNLLLSVLEDTKSSGNQAVAPPSASSSWLLEMATVDQPSQLSRKPVVAPTSLNSTDALGVRVLRKALQEMEAHAANNKFEQQLWLEERSHAAAVESAEEEFKRLPESVRSLSQVPSDLVASWNTALVPVLTREVKLMSEYTEDLEDYPLVPYLKLVKPEVLSKIVITELIRPPTRQEMKSGQVVGEAVLARLASAVGKKVEAEFNAQRAKKASTKHKLKLSRSIHHLHTQGKLFNVTVRRVIAQLSRKYLSEDNIWNPRFPDSIRISLGVFLIERLLRVARVRVQDSDPDNPDRYVFKDEAAFSHGKKWSKDGKTLGVIRYHPALYDILSKHAAMVDPWLLPMLIPPKPWVTWKSGGYLEHRVKMVRIRGDRTARAYLQAADQEHKLSTVAQALDALGAVPWRINEDVYRIAAEMWNNGEHASSLPAPLHIPEVEKPTDFESNPEAKKKYYYEVQKRTLKLRENYSQRADANYKLEIARAVRILANTSICMFLCANRLI